MPPVRIGLMGGTFDPIHYGHLFIAEEARARCNLDRVVFIPNHRPAHRDGKRARLDAEVRYRLTELAIAGNPFFVASRVELDRPGPSFAIDTVHQLQTELGAEAELHFIVGSDSLADLKTWHRSEELFRACRFIALTRPGFDLEATGAGLTAVQRERIEVVATMGLEIASTELRRRCALGLPIRYLAPDKVEEEIRRRSLYRDAEAEGDWL